jgi:hypothetical protein
MDNALCGGAGATLTGNALSAVKAAIFMGDPHNRNGLPYNVGTCKAQGVSIHSIKLLQHIRLTRNTVCCPSCWLPMQACQHEHNPKLLRCG